MTRLRVVSFNIRNGRAVDGWHAWWFRRWALLRALEGLDADVLGLQEVHRFQLRWLERRLPDHHVVGAGRDDGRTGEHTPVLVRPGGPAMSSHRTRWFGDAPDTPGTVVGGARFPRIATTATLVLDDGTFLQVTSTHLDERSRSRREHSMEQLLGWLDHDLPQVVLGDLNAEPGDRVLRLAAEAGLRQTLPADAGGTVHRFTGRTDGRRIDHVLVSPDIAVERAEIVTTGPRRRLPSDHWPVVADLVVGDADR